MGKLEEINRIVGLIGGDCNDGALISDVYLSVLNEGGYNRTNIKLKYLVQLARLLQPTQKHLLGDLIPKLMELYKEKGDIEVEFNFVDNNILDTDFLKEEPIEKNELEQQLKEEKMKKILSNISNQKNEEYEDYDYDDDDEEIPDENGWY